MDVSSTNPGTLCEGLPCNVCHIEGGGTERSVVCSVCSSVVHFHCSRLPPYMLYVLTSHRRLYLCEVCAHVPETFLLQLISNNNNKHNNNDNNKNNNGNGINDINNNNNINSNENNDNSKNINSNENNDNEDNIDIDISNRMINNSNNNCKDGDNHGVINTEASNTEKNDNGCDHISMEPQDKTSSHPIINNTTNDSHCISTTINDVLPKISDWDLTLRETEQFIASLGKSPFATSISSKEKLRNANLMEKMVSRMESLQKQINGLSKQPSLQTMMEEKRLLEQEVMEHKLNSKEKEYLIKSLVQGVESKQNIINIINTQLGEANERNKKLETNLSLALERINNDKEIYNNNNNNTMSISNDNNYCKSQEDGSKCNEDIILSDTGYTGNDKVHITTSPAKYQPRVLLFHDALCEKVNDTILSKEGVVVEKVSAPTLLDVMAKLDEVEGKVDLVVLQSFLQSVRDMSLNDLIKLTAEIVNKCLTKSKKVVIGTIVKTGDDDTTSSRIDVFTASLKLAFAGSSDVFICHNDNLDDSRYRVANVEGDILTTHGTALLATNFKYKMAEALGISVVKKRVVRSNKKNGGRLSA